MNKILIKVLIPLYNREKYLCQCLDSVLNQKTDFNFQVVIIDDASTDNSLEIAKKYQNKFPNLFKIIIHKNNLGLLSTIIDGYKELKGVEYFTVLDPDDYWLTNDKLQNAVDFLEKNNDFTIYATNTIILKEKSQDSIHFIPNAPKKSVFQFKKLIDNKEKVYFGHTSSSVYRNIIFKNSVPSRIIQAIGSNCEPAFRGDVYRNIAHLHKGKAIFFNKDESVYRILDDGIWSRLSTLSQLLFNANLNYCFVFYFNQQYSNYFLNQCAVYLDLIYKHISLKENFTFTSNKEIKQILKLNIYCLLHRKSKLSLKKCIRMYFPLIRNLFINN